MDTKEVYGCAKDGEVNHCVSCVLAVNGCARAYKASLPSVQQIKDSGNREEFSTGAVRDVQVGKGSPHLMPIGVIGEYLEDEILKNIEAFRVNQGAESLYAALDLFCKSEYEDNESMFLDVAIHYEEGAKKYGPYNWQKGIPVSSYVDSMIRHYLKWRRGDKDEPHNRAFVWNVLCCVWTVSNHEVHTS